MGVTKDTVLGEIIEKKGIPEVLSEHNVPCISCPFAKMEMDVLKIGEICESYGINCEELLKDINKALSKGKEK
jgi:hypothetical protein